MIVGNTKRNTIRFHRKVKSFDALSRLSHCYETKGVNEMKKIWLSDLSVVITAVVCAAFLALRGDLYALVTCLLTIGCVAIVHAAFHYFRLPIPYFLYVLILIFIVLAMILGKMLNFYGFIPEWDFYLHLVSGGILALLGYLFYYHMVNFTVPATAKKSLPCWFVFLFCAAAAGVWEIFEFSGDMLFGLQSQEGSLIDTMTDMIAGNIGCLIALFFIARHEHGKTNKMLAKMLKKGRENKKSF